ncbi:hypothetical protein T492DRAFT_851369, partial [Pavlovales sp. CCMP2436]
RYADAPGGSVDEPLTRRLLVRNATAEPERVRLRAPRSPAFSLSLGDGAEVELDGAGLTYAHLVPLVARAGREVEADALVGRVDTDIALLSAGQWALPGQAPPPAAAPLKRTDSLATQLLTIAQAQSCSGADVLDDFEAELTPISGVSDLEELRFYSQLVSSDLRATYSKTASGRASASASVLGAETPSGEDPAGPPHAGDGVGGTAVLPSGVGLEPRSESQGIGGARTISIVDMPRQRVRVRPQQESPRGDAATGAPSSPSFQNERLGRGEAGGEGPGATMSSSQARALPAMLTAVLGVSEDSELAFYKQLMHQRGPTPAADRGAEQASAQPAALGALIRTGGSRPPSRDGPVHQAPPGEGGSSTLPPVPAGGRSRATGSQGAATAEGSPYFMVNGVLLDARGRAIAAPPREQAAFLPALDLFPRTSPRAQSSCQLKGSADLLSERPSWGLPVAPEQTGRAGSQASVAKLVAPLSQDAMDANWDAIG